MTEEPEAGSEEPLVEPRWPVVLAVSTYIVITVVVRIAIPRRESLGPHWFVPGLEIALLAVLLLANPLRVSRQARWLRRLSITLLILAVFSAIVSSATLITQLITGSSVANSADSLLASGVLVWFGNALVFGLLYWQLDSGGPLARARGERPYPDFAFTHQLNPDLAPPGWRPKYVDYCALGITTSTAFSPTDVMPLSPWAKLTMSAQSLISLAVIGLVIARAVNVFS
jgi:hypothetical protein